MENKKISDGANFKMVARGLEGRCYNCPIKTPKICDICIYRVTKELLEEIKEFESRKGVDKI